jgi:phospholipid/cholesterol/gamma-HCH transport system substrate-binding protein
LFTIVFVVAGVLALWWFGDTREATHTYILETRDSVTGLNTEAQVRYRGIRAGKVRDIRPDPDDGELLLVEITLGRQYRLTDKSVAKLETRGITGIAYVSLEESAPGGKPIEDNSAAPPRLSIQPGLLQQLGANAADIGEQVAELSRRLNQLLNERNLDNLGRSLENIATASDSLKAMPALMASLREVLSAANRARLHALLAHLEKTAGETAPLAVEARTLVIQMSSLAQRLDTLAAQAGATGERLNAVTLPHAEALIRDLSLATRRIDRLVDTVQETPQAMMFGTSPPHPGPGEAGYEPLPAQE